jgi:hypothetical protein
MAQIPGWLLRHKVVVEPAIGEGAHGTVLGPPGDPVRALVRSGVRLVRAPDGREVTCTTTVFGRRSELAIPVGSRVTLPDGRTTTAIVVLDQDGGGLPTPDHVEVACE